MIETKHLWFYGTDLWQRYLDAIPQPWHHNYGDQGNLIVMLDEQMEMRRRLRRGHKSDIKRADQNTTVVFDTDGEWFDVYQTLHEADAGRKTRPQASFDVMREWIVTGHAVLAIALRDHHPIGAGLFIIHEDGSYYASAAREPSLAATESVGHLIVWKTMCWLVDRGYAWLDLGPVPTSDDPKELSIYRFKRGFGGEVKS